MPMSTEDALNIAAAPADATDEQLTDALDAIRSEAQALAASGTKDDIAALEALTEAGGILNSAVETRTAERAELKSKSDALLAKLGLTADPETDPDTDSDTDADADGGDDVAPDTIEGIDDTPAPAEPAAPAAPAAPVPAAASAEPVIAAGPAHARDGFSAARRKARRPEPVAPKSSGVFAASDLPGRWGQDREVPDFDSFANAVIDAVGRNRPSGRIWHDRDVERAQFAEYGGGKKVNLARFNTRWGGDVRRLTEDPKANASVLDQVRQDTLRQFGQALTAAGGVPCAPYPVDYSIFNLVDSYNPIEADLPAVDMPRGGLRYLAELSYATYASGVEVRDATDENAAPESYVEKACVRIECPDELSTSPLFVPACLTVGNFIQNTFPELVKQALEWLGVIYEDTKQQTYEDAIRAQAVATTAMTWAAVYGAARDYFNGVARALAGYRARRHMRPEAPLHVHVPYFLPGILAEDVRNNAYEGLTFNAGVNDYDAWFRSELRKLHAVPTYWYIKPTSVASNKWIDQAQASGAINAWPTTVETIIHAPGVWNRGVIADIDFGLIVDSPLIRTNDAMFFMETMYAVFPRSTTATEILTSTLTPDGKPGKLPV